jgi:UDP-3-O-[3-hydroxymyristoyl] glucosamine N-acyltransferase
VKRITLGDLAEKLGGVLDGDPEVTVCGVESLHTAGPDKVSFLANPKYRSSLETTSAAGVIVSRETQAPGLVLIRVDDPYLGFAMAMELFYSEPYEAADISDDASIHHEARIGNESPQHPPLFCCLPPRQDRFPGHADAWSIRGSRSHDR